MNLPPCTHASVATLVTLALAEPGTSVPDVWLEASLPLVAGALAGLAAELVRGYAALLDPPRDPVELWREWLLDSLTEAEA